MVPPPFLSSLVLSFEKLDADAAPQIAERLRAVAGVKDVVVLVEEKVAYLKVDRQQLDEPALDVFQATAGKA